MSALALHSFSRTSGLIRWCAAALVILLLHGAVGLALLRWFTRAPTEPNGIISAIAVSLAPATGGVSTPQDDLPVGPPMEQAEQAPPEPDKTEQQPIEQPPPPQQAEVTLPKPEPKVQERKKTIERRPPAPETRAPAKSEHAQQNVTSSPLYGSLVYGHLQRFKRGLSNAASGRTVVQFTLDRRGQVLSSSVTQSSGNAALDREALDIVRRANPFPPFPADLAGAQGSFSAPIRFGS